MKEPCSDLSSIPDDSEVSRIFRDYKKALRATGYFLVSFRTPIQRALSLSKKAAAVSVLQKRKAQQSNNFLPPGPNTVYGIDMIRVLACAQRSYHVTVPISLLWNPGKAIVLVNGSDGEIRVKTTSKLRDGFADFLQEVASQLGSTQSKFTYKLEGNSSVLLRSVAEAEAHILSNQACPQRLQPFLAPYHRHTAHLRVQWLSSRSRNVYFVRVKSTSSLGTHPCLARSLPALSRSFSNIESLNTNNVVAATRLNPIAEIETAMSECVKAIGETQKGRKVKELVCDFICDVRQKWVLVNTVGYSFSQHMKAKSELVQQTSLDLKLILTPLLAQRKSFRLSIKPNQISLNQTITPVPEARKNPHTPMFLKKPLRLYKDTTTLPHWTYLHTTVSKFDEICANVQRLKRQEMANLVEKYGESLWKDVVKSTISDLFTELNSTTEGLESVGNEQASMIQKGFLRIIQGDYNFYYVSALSRVHKSLNITPSMYATFLVVLSAALAATYISPAETTLILKRFQDLQPAICSGNT